MSDESFDIGLLHEVVITAKRAGWTPNDFNSLRSDVNLCRDLLPVIRGRNMPGATERGINPIVAPFAHHEGQASQGFGSRKMGAGYIFVPPPIVTGKIMLSENDRMVDLDVAPNKKATLNVKTHKQGGLWRFDKNHIGLFCADDQDNSMITGLDVLRTLADQPVMNSNLLRWYLSHCEQIPSEWADKSICFWGTIWSNANDEQYVEYLTLDVGRWRSFAFQLSEKWGNNRPAIVLKKA